MRLTATLCTVLAVISFFSFNVEGRIIKRDDSVKTCQETIKEYSECTTYKEKITKNNIENYCKAFTSEKCQKLYSGGLKSIPSCANLSKETIDATQIKFDTVNYTFKLLCAKDESGKFCPFSEIYITKGNQGFDKDGFDNSLNETCKSKKCIDSALEAFTFLESSGLANNNAAAKTTANAAANTAANTTAKTTTNNANTNVKREVTEGPEAVSTIIKKLKDQTCTAQAKADSKSSDATTLTIGNALLVTLGLLLLLN